MNGTPSNTAPQAGAGLPQTPRRPPSSIIGKTAWGSFASLSTTAASAVSVVVVARLLGVSGAGEVAYGIWLAATVAQVALLALPNAAMRFLAASSDRPGVARWLVRRAALLVVPGGLVAVVAAFASHPSTAIAGATAVLTGAAMLSAVAQAIVAGEQKFRRLAILSALSSVILIVATVLGCVAGGPVGALLGQSVGQGPFLVGLFGHDSTRPREPVLRRLRAFAFQTWIAATATLVAWSRLEFVFLQAHGPDAVALYSTALTIAQVGVQPATLLASALVPHFSELIGEDHVVTARDTFAAVTRIFASFALPVCFGLAALAPALIPALFGRAFAEAAVPASIVVASASLVAIAPAATALLYAHERTRYHAAVAIVSAIAALVGFASVIPRFGQTGAAIVRSVVQGFAVVAVLGYAVRRLGTRVPVRQVAAATAGASIAAIAARVVVDLVGSTWTSVAAGAATMVLAYVLLARRLRVLDATDVPHLAPLVARLPKPLRRSADALVRSLAR